MSTPAWTSASTGSQANASAVDQFLGTHAITYLYTGASLGGQATSSGTQAINSSTLAVEQRFTMSGTSITRVNVGLNGVTGGGANVVLGLYTDSSGNPGTLVTSTTIPLEWFSAAGLLSIPVNATGLTNTATYHWVFTSPSASGGVFSTLNTGASVGFVLRTTSTFPTGWANGTTSIQMVWYSGTSGKLYNTIEDSGARITALNYSAASGNVTATAESTGGTSSYRTLSTTVGALTAVT